MRCKEPRIEAAKAHQRSEAGSREQNTRGRFFQRRLAESQGSTPRSARRWRAGIYDFIRDVMSLQGGLSIGRMCQLAGVSRSGFYCRLRARDADEEEMQVRSAIQRLAVGHEGHYGYRRITAELRRAGMLVNTRGWRAFCARTA